MILPMEAGPIAIITRTLRLWVKFIAQPKNQQAPCEWATWEDVESDLLKLRMLQESGSPSISQKQSLFELRHTAKARKTKAGRCDENESHTANG